MPGGVIRIAASDLEQSGEPTADVTLSGTSLKNPQALAFDKNGALWVGDWEENSVVRFDSARLSSDYSGPPDASLLGQRPPPVVGALSGPASLAFDAEGNLWVGYFGPNIVARYTPEEQETVGAVTPPVQLQVGVLALIEGMAFDDAGGLWLTGKLGQVARLAPSVLTSSDSDLNEGAVFLTIQGSAQDLALNPPAAGTPIVR
jgi:streptogramin lyase